MPSITTGAAKGIDVVMAGAAPTAMGISVTDALTTGDMLYLDNGGGTTTGDGKFINCNDDNTSVFSVASGGNVTTSGRMVLTQNTATLTNNENKSDRFQCSHDFYYTLNNNASVTMTTLAMKLLGNKAHATFKTGTSGTDSVSWAKKFILVF